MNGGFLNCTYGMSALGLFPTQKASGNMRYFKADGW